MVYARHLAKRGRKVLVVDESAEGELRGRLPLPKEAIDCLYYQGVDYQIVPDQPTAGYDIVLKYRDFGTADYDLVIADWEKNTLLRALELAVAGDALLLVLGAPERGTIRRLLKRRGTALPDGQLIELVWNKKDMGVFLRLEYGLRVTFSGFSREFEKILLHLTEKLGKEECSVDHGILE